jgi:hypothetical protein
MFIYTLEFLGSALYSILLETAVIALLIRFAWKQVHLPWQAIVAAGVSATLATIPYVWFVFPVLFYSSPTGALIFAEIFAVLFETAVYALWLHEPLHRAFLLSLSANAASYFTGQILEPSRLFTGS